MRSTIVAISICTVLACASWMIDTRTASCDQKDIPRPVGEQSPPATKAAAWAYGEEHIDLPGSPELGDHILRHLTANDLELSRATQLAEGKSLGHHLGFMNTRLLQGKQVPTVPFVVNGSYPPNAPSPRRLYRLGQAIAEAYGVHGFDPETFVCLGSGQPIGYPDIEFDVEPHEWEIFEPVDRDRGDALLALAWAPDAPPGW